MRKTCEGRKLGKEGGESGEEDIRVSRREGGEGGREEREGGEGGREGGRKEGGMRGRK